MKKLHLLATVCALALFTITSNANAAIVDSDDTSIAGMGQSDTQTIAVSPSLFPDVVQTLNLPGDSRQTQPDKNLNPFINSTLSASPHSDSHSSLWLFLIVAAVFGILAEIYHRKSLNQKSSHW